MNLFKSGRREVIWTKLKTLVEKRRILTQVILSSSIGKELCISIAGGEEEGGGGAAIPLIGLSPVVELSICSI